MAMTRWILTCFLLVASHPALADDEPVVIPWDANQSLCVAWEADKLFLLVSDERPVGMACEGAMVLEQGPEGVRSVVEVPVEAFNSGEEARDEAVLEILSGGGAQTIVFKSKFLQRSDWRTLISGQSGTLEGDLTIAGITTSVKLNFKRDGQHITGRVETSFSALKLEPPSVGWGSITLVRDPLVLHFRFLQSLAFLL